MLSKSMAPPRLASLLRSRSFRRPVRIILQLLPFILIAPIVLYVLLAYVLRGDPRLFPSTLRNAKNLLIVTAHPDDECLFFSPTILGILEAKPQTVGGLLVLSTGNNYGVGEMRKIELKGSCDALGISPDRCVALDQKDLQDNPKVWWSEDAIIADVKEYVEKWKVDLILTFDIGGISGHINHRAVSAAISKYASTDEKAPPTYLLSSTHLIRKYTFLGDLPLTSLSFSWRIFRAFFSSAKNSIHDYSDKALIVSPWSSYLKTRHAFASHGSQYSWDRVLYLILSRHIWFNDLKKVERKHV